MRLEAGQTSSVAYFDHVSSWNIEAFITVINELNKASIILTGK
jgi:hypothetical protein